MTRPRSRSAALRDVLALVVAVSIGLACANKQSAECFCDNAPGVTIRAPPGAISAVKLGGAACTDAFPVCQGTSPDIYPAGCGETQLFPRHGGACDVEIDFADGRVFRRSVALLFDDCCAMARAAAPDGGAIDVP